MQACGYYSSRYIQTDAFVLENEAISKDVLGCVLTHTRRFNPHLCMLGERVVQNAWKQNICTIPTTVPARASETGIGKDYVQLATAPG